MVFVHFENGELVPENVVLVDEKNYHFAVKGKLVNSTFLENPVKVQIDGVGDHNCLQVIKTKELPEEKVLDQGNSLTHLLLVKFLPFLETDSPRNF